MTRRPPLTDRAIGESLGEEREAPPDLSRSISAYAHSTRQPSGLPGLGRLTLQPALAGGRALAIAVLVLLMLVALGVAIQIGSRPRLSLVPPSDAPSIAASYEPAPSTGPPLPAGWSHVGDVPREDGDGVVVESDGLLVIANAARGELAFLDPAAGAAGRIVNRLELGASGRGLPMARRDDGWWIGSDGAGEIVAFDPATRSLGRRLAIDGQPYNLASAGAILYVADFERGQLLRVDTSSARVTAVVVLDRAAGVAVLSDGSVLVASRPGTLRRVDPVTLATVEEIAIQGDVMTLIPDGNRVIVTRNNADRLSTIDPADLTRGEDLRDTRISAFLVADDAAWGIDWMNGDVLRLDRDSLAIVERVPAISTGQDGIAVAAGDLWIEGTADGQPVVHRLRPPSR